ncbi:MAG: hypothetical protein LBB50_01250 [Oscillospiraceae bacterium]|jgi:putative ABC transport system permease protein|nr:hypothetical protein [Oscillospiraceae bacterium]
MTKALFRDTLRAIRKTLSRFVSIVIIVALGVGFYAGLKAVSPNMKVAADQFYQEHKLADVVVQSTVGFDENDVQAVQALPGVASVTPSRSIDGVLYKTDGDMEQGLTGTAYVMRIIGYDFQNVSEDRRNQLTLVDGTWPQKPNECVVSAYENQMDKNHYALRQNILIKGDHENLLDTVQSELYTVVGVVHTPEFVSMELGASQAGGGELSGYIYIPDSAFKVDYYTTLYVGAQGTEGLEAYTDAYNDAVRRVRENLEQAALPIVKERVDRLQDYYQPLIEKGRLELKQAKTDGLAKLKKAEEDIAYLKKRVAEAPAQIAAEEAKGLAQIDAAKQELTAGQKEYTAGKALYDASNAKYLAGKKEYETGKAQYEAGLKEYNAGLKKYNKGLAEYLEAKKIVDLHPNARQEYEEGKNKLEVAQNSYEIAKLGIAVYKSALRVAHQAVDSGDPQRIKNALSILAKYFPMNESDLTLEGMQANLADADEDLAGQEIALADGLKQIEDGKKELAAAEKEIKKLEEFEKGSVELTAAKKELDAAYKELTGAEAKLAAGKDEIAKAERELPAARAKLSAAKAQIDATPAQIAEGEETLARELKKARQELAGAQSRAKTADAEYAAGVAEYDQKVADGERQIRRAENQMAALPNAQWIATNRDTFAGYTNYGDTADNMQAFALVFPALFFLIAALVSLTTMTRMVEDERMQLGVLKAAGYTARAIAFKYLFYAFTAGVLGCVLGTALGFSLIPIAIFKAYSILYLIPTMHPGFFAGTALFGLAAALISTVGAVIFSVLRELQNRPAQLLRPKAPKAGKRVFLELLPGVWNRLGFNGKVTVRNLMRNKKRFFMTFAGIMGCTALLLTGFGIGNSIGTMLPKQFGPDSVMRFDGQALLQAPIHTGDAQVLSVFNQPGRIDDVLPVYMKSMYAGTEAFGRQIEVTVAVPDNREKIPNFVTLKDDKTGKVVDVTDEGVYINGKTAEVMNLKKGDTITIQSGGMKADIPVAGITRNYVYHYIYMTPPVFEKYFGIEETTYNVVLLKLNPALSKSTGSDKVVNEAKEARAQLGRDLGDTAEVITVVYNQSIIDSVGSMINIMRNVIVAVFTVAAGALAFVVLYNLNNINIYERIRELATIKVLGFYDNEADMFIYRENIIITILGILGGLALGVPIHGFVIRTAEIESMMFVRTLAPNNFMAAAIITAVFALLINALMHKKIKEINMVEALKSVE